MKVLIVEDLKVMRRVIANTLKSLKIDQILEAEDGVDALGVLQGENEEDIGLIITDWLMPNMDGLELVYDIRKEDRFRDVPILMITSVDDKEHVLKALKAGTNDYIAKPFKPEILRMKIAGLIRYPEKDLDTSSL